MAVSLYYNDSGTPTQIPLGGQMSRQSITVATAGSSFTVTATFTSLLVYLDGLLCDETTNYTVSGQVVTFTETIPVGSVINFISFS